jgi:peptide/nickel transport system permease protein
LRNYILNRLLLIPPTLLVISLIVFASIRMLPGGALDERLAEAGVAAVDRERIKDEMGLNRPAHEQYIEWIGGVLTGDLGDSLFHHETVNTRVMSALPITIELGVASILLSLLVGVPAGIFSALRAGTRGDLIVRSLGIGALSVPNFWIGTLAIVMPAIWWGWIPPTRYYSILDQPLQNVAVIILPAAILSLRLGATVMRMLRSEVLEVIRADYVRTARAKGIRESTIITRHVLKNAAIPVVTLVGLSIANLLGGSVIMESIFNLPGLGRLMLTAIREREFGTIQSVVLLIGLFVMVTNLLVDMLYGFLNPQIRQA